MPKYTTFAVVNGAGKTSIYNSIYYNENKDEKISFNQETTLSGRSILKNIKLAKENGFYISMNYIGVGNSQIAKDRVKVRVSLYGTTEIFQIGQLIY
jgi:predicted ABC-type ATPase